MCVRRYLHEEISCTCTWGSFCVCKRALCVCKRAHMRHIRIFIRNICMGDIYGRNVNTYMRNPPKNGLIALQTPRTSRFPTFCYCQVVNRALLRLLSKYVLVWYKVMANYNMKIEEHFVPVAIINGLILR